MLGKKYQAIHYTRFSNFLFILNTTKLLASTVLKYD